MLLKMAQPALALSLLQELGLAPAVYAPPEHLVPPPPEGGFNWLHGTAVARAAARLLAFRSNLSEVGVGGGRPKSRAVKEGAPLAGSAEGAEDTVGRSGPASGQVGMVELGTGANSTSASSCGGTQKGEKTTKGGDERTDATAGSKRDRVGASGKDGSGDTKDKDAPATLLRELFLSAALLPLTGVKHKTKKGKLVPAAQSVVSDSLKVALVLHVQNSKRKCFESGHLRRPMR